MPFVETREHARFSEFAIACTTDRYIGVCHGRPGVGKTRSAREFSACPNLFDYIPGKPISPVLARAVEGCRGLFFTAPVSNTPKIVNDRLQSNLFRLGHARLTLVGLAKDTDTFITAETACPLLVVDEADRPFFPVGGDAMTKSATGGHPDLKMVNPAAAAIDIGSTMHMAAVSPDASDMPVRPARNGMLSIVEFERGRR